MNNCGPKNTPCSTESSAAKALLNMNINSRKSATCSTESAIAKKIRVLNNGSNNAYTNKRMRYASYVQSEPGFNTFANKKLPVLQPVVAKKQSCFRNILCNL
jgi:hypothetical protein